MKGRLALTLALVLTSSAASGATLRGTVTAKGMRNNADAVVYVAEAPGKSFAPAMTTVEMDQKDMEFIPHVLAVQAGTTVEFLNSDAFLHNVFTPDKCAEKFNLGTWPQGQKRSYTFSKPCAAVLLCKVHPEMEAFVVVTPSPYYAVTNAKGEFEIEDLPDGEYTVKVWHPKLKEISKNVAVTGSTTVEFALK